MVITVMSHDGSLTVKHIDSATQSEKKKKKTSW